MISTDSLAVSETRDDKPPLWCPVFCWLTLIWHVFKHWLVKVTFQWHTDCVINDITTNKQSARRESAANERRDRSLSGRIHTFLWSGWVCFHLRAALRWSQRDFFVLQVIFICKIKCWNIELNMTQTFYWLVGTQTMFFFFLALPQLFFIHELKIQSYSKTCLLIKNIFTKNVHFYTTVVRYMSLQDPWFWFNPIQTSCQYIIISNLLKCFF